MQRELQVAGRHDEQGHAGPRDHVQDGHPDGIGFREDQRSLAAQVERLAAMRHDHQEAGHDPHPVDPDFPLRSVHVRSRGRSAG